VLVRVRAAALNHLDLWVRRGIPGVEISFPRTLGADGAGEIAGLGPGAREALAALPFDGDPPGPGDAVVLNPGLSCGRCEFCLRGEEGLCIRYRLLGEHRDGTLAELVAVPAANVFPAPAGLSLAERAAFPLVFLTAWRLLLVRGRLRAGETVLIHGAGGGVAGAALAIAVDAGARVMATSSSEAKRARALELGAERAAPRGREDVLAAVREWTGKRGVDVVVESVGKATWATSVDAVARGGRIVVCGATTGGDPPALLTRIFWKQVDVLGSTMGSRADLLALLRRIGAGRLRPVIDSVFPLDEAGAALDRLASGAQFGKVVVEIA
jgi:NADPH:quinone reductase-like Zn-dependent oxidoreductase